MAIPKRHIDVILEESEAMDEDEGKRMDEDEEKRMELEKEISSLREYFDSFPEALRILVEGVPDIELRQIVLLAIDNFPRAYRGKGSRNGDIIPFTGVFSFASRLGSIPPLGR